MKKYVVFICCVTAVLTVFCVFSAENNGTQTYSALWGEAGELWTPYSRLPDYSFAGYERGEAPLPELPVTHNIGDFGAVGDGVHDDTAAFQRAVAEVTSGVISIPPGRYIISDIIEIQKPNLVLRGAGKEHTTLYFPKTLTDVRPDWGATSGGWRTSNYSWSGGFIWVSGGNAGASLAEPGNATRGDSEIPVSDTTRFTPGQEIMLILHDDDAHSLVRYMYSDDPGSIRNLESGICLTQVFRVVDTAAGRIRVERPLRADIRPEWQPELIAFAPTVTRVGIEDVTFEFPAEPYRGHFKELGHNAIAMGGVAHCWIRDVHIKNAEGGVFFHGRFSRIEGVSFSATKRGDYWTIPGAGHRAFNCAAGHAIRPVVGFEHTGHHAISISGEDNVITGFDFQTCFLHDLAVSIGSAGNVFSNGRGVDMNFDHHRRGPYENLFTNIHVGRGSRVWASSGGMFLGRHCAVRGTFWNLRADNPLKPPFRGFGPWSVNVVGITTRKRSSVNPDGRWFEAIRPELLQPQNIHEAQRQRRLQRQ